MMVKAAAQLAQVKKTHVRMVVLSCCGRVVSVDDKAARLVPLFTEGAASAPKAS